LPASCSSPIRRSKTWTFWRTFSASRSNTSNPDPAFRGREYVRHIVAWAEAFGRAAQKQWVRLDTGRDNERLNAYYLQCGFVFCGIKQFEDDGDHSVPKHYLGSGLSLFEKKID
jgi:hypothetical protein